ncbi:cysteine proteinase, partial [Pluteus cervinus]
LLSDPVHNTRLLTEQLESLGLYAAPTLGDGNCLFRALSDQLYGSPSKHHQLRQDICNWIATNKQRYEPFVDDERGIDVHLQCMRENATYGGHMELSAFAHLTRRNVKVIQPGLVYVIDWSAGWDNNNTTNDNTPSSSSNYSSSSSSSLTTPDEDDRPPRKTSGLGKKGKSAREDEDEDELPDTVYVAYHDWEHFSSIRNLSGPHTGPPRVCEIPPQPVPVPPPPPPTTAPPDKPKSKVTKVKLKLSAAPGVSATLATSSTSTGTLAPTDPLEIPLPSSRSVSPPVASTSTSTSLTAAITPALTASNGTPRITRSPKRSFDESSNGSSMPDDPPPEESVAKRTRSSLGGSSTPARGTAGS